MIQTIATFTFEDPL